MESVATTRTMGRWAKFLSHYTGGVVAYPRTSLE